MAFAGDDWEIDEDAAIAPQIYRVLRDRIVQNEWRPGEKISEQEVATRFGISRQPVRETFIRLSGEGLLSVRPQRGTTVRRVELAAVLDARFLREAAEADVVGLLARAPDRAAIVERLRELIERQRAVAERDHMAFMRLDEAFHRTMAEGAGKASIWDAVHRLKAQMDRVRFLSLSHFPMRTLVDQHAAIADRVADGAAPDAQAALRRHLRQILNDLPHIVDEHPDLFDVRLNGGEDKIVELQGGETA